MTSGGGTVSTGGCGAVDTTFGNFGVSSTVFSPSLTTNGVDAFTTQESVAAQIDFVRANGSPFSVTGAGNNQINTGTAQITYLTQFGAGTSPSFTDVQNIDLTFAGVILPAAQGTNFASISVTLGVCENPTSLGGATNNTGLTAFSNCSGLGGTYLSKSFNIANTSATTAITGDITFALALNQPVSVIALNNSINLIANHTGQASFTGFYEGFAAPEPSSFVLLGSALAGLGFLRFRKRKA